MGMMTSSPATTPARSLGLHHGRQGVLLETNFIILDSHLRVKSHSQVTTSCVPAARCGWCSRRRELATSCELGVAAHCSAAAVAPLLLLLLLPLLPVFVAVNVHVFTVHGVAFTP